MDRNIILLALTLSTAAMPAAGAEPVEPPRLTVPRVARPPRRSDFESMDVAAAPLGMRRVEGFVQRFPDDNAPVSEGTVVFVGYDQRFLYVAFLCFDRDVDRVGAHMVPRDAFPSDEDT